MSVVAELMQAFAMAINGHNDANPDHNVLAIGMNGFDMERLHLDGGPSGMFRVICDGEHEGEKAEAAQETVKAVSDPNPGRTNPVYA